MTTEPTAAPALIRAPFTPEQVAALNAFQRRGGMHPFTCGGEHAPGSPILVARADGWHCTDPYGEACDYRQDWAHAFMADPDAWPKPFRTAWTESAIPVDGPASPPCAPVAGLRMDQSDVVAPDPGTQGCRPYCVAGPCADTCLRMDDPNPIDMPDDRRVRTAARIRTAREGRADHERPDISLRRSSQIYFGEDAPTARELALYAEACGVTVDWLLTGIPGATSAHPTSEPYTYQHPETEVSRTAPTGPVVRIRVLGGILGRLNGKNGGGDSPAGQFPAATVRAVLTEILAEILADMQPTPTPAGPDPAGDGLRERYAEAIREWHGDWTKDTFAQAADAVLAVRDGEMERLRGERDDALGMADADSKQLAEVDERCDTAVARIARLMEAVEHAERLAVQELGEGAVPIWTGVVREILTGPEPTP